MQLKNNIFDEVNSENRLCAGWLLFCEERKLEQVAHRHDVLDSIGSASGYQESIASKYSVGDPTYEKAKRLIGRYEKYNEWLKLVKFIEENLPDHLRIFLKLRRQYRFSSGRHGWTVPVQMKFAEEYAMHTGRTQEEVWIENRHTFKLWWKTIINITARYAAKKGLLT